MTHHSEGYVQHINPDEIIKNPAFTNVVVTGGSVKTIYIGGLDANDAAGNIIGKGDIKVQVEQVFKNLKAALAAAGANLEHVIKLNVYIVQGQSLYAGFEIFQREWDNRPNPPAVTVLFVAGLAHPDYLVELDAIAVVPQ